MRLSVKLFLVFLLLCCVDAKATNYYFSSQTGDDSRSSIAAQQPSTPWKTLAKLNSFFLNLQPGDSILFKRGETFYGQIVVTASGQLNLPIVFGAYGAGEKPVISGMVELSNWSFAGNNIWETINAALSDAVNTLTIDGRLQITGRYPNTNAPNDGYLVYEKHNGNSQITDNELTGNFTGGQVVIRKNRFILDKADIVSQSGGSLNYIGSSTYLPTDLSGYFIQNHLATLDQAGEWCYDKSLKKISMYQPGGSNPNNSIILASAITTVIQVWNGSHIKFDGLRIEGANNNALELYGSTDIVVNNCTVAFSFNGIAGISNNSVVIDSAQIFNCGNDAVFFQSVNNSILRNSSVKNSGVVRGMGSNGDDAYEGIVFRGSDNLIEKNIIDSTGYTALQFAGDRTTVQNNYITNFNFIKDDGGGIYTWRGNSSPEMRDMKILNNIILNGIGAEKAVPDDTMHMVQGIYIDENSGYIQVNGNTVSNCNSGGIYLHNSHNIDVIGNTVYDNAIQLLIHENSANLVRNNTFYSNIFFARKTQQMAARYISDNNDIGSFGSFNNNYYCRPADDRFVIDVNVGTQYFTYTLDNWKAAFNLDLNSGITPVQIPAYIVAGLNGSNKFSNGTLQSDLSGISYWSPVNNFNPTWTNNGNLDGGCLKADFKYVANIPDSNKYGVVTIPVGQISADKKYLLRFSCIGTKDNENFQVNLRKYDTPYNYLNGLYYVGLSKKRTENEIVFSNPPSENNAALVFQVSQQDSILYLDNIQLYDANIQIVNPDDYLRFEYNASGNNKSVDLGGNTYVDVAKNIYTGTLTLAPWSSVILIKTVASVLPVAFSDFSGKLTGSTVMLDWTTQTIDTSLVFDVERSPDGRAFIKIGSVESKKYVSLNGSYQYRDINPLADKNYYRIKQVDKTGEFLYSKTILIRNGKINTLSISPNPAKNFVNITLPATLATAELNIQISTMTGQLVEKRTVNAPGNQVTIDVEKLPAGIYVLEIKTPAASYTASIIKQ